MIKLIASDIDGTLLTGGNREIPAKVIEYIDILSQYGVVFATASGRQYPNLRRLFLPVADKIAYICENGAFIKYKGEVLFKSAMDCNAAIELLKDIEARDNCEFLISGKEVSYIKPKEEGYLIHMRDHVKNDIVVINDFKEIKEDIIKVSVYNKNGIDNDSSYYHEKFGSVFKDTVSGKCWMDFVNKDVNKGAALKILKEKIGADFEESASFGDNFNDLEMFEETYYSYAMNTSCAEIRNSARYVTHDVESVLFDINMMYLWQK